VAIGGLENALKGNGKSDIDARIKALSSAGQKLGDKMYSQGQGREPAANDASGRRQSAPGGQRRKTTTWSMRTSRK